MAKTLYEYYTGKGQALPSVAARAPLAAQYGIQNYTGTAEQNNLLLSKLEATGGATNIPGATPPPVAGGAPAPALPSGGLAPASAGTNMAGDLGNLRIALREALNEAGRKRVENNFKALGGLASGAAPGSIGSIVDLVRGGIKAPVETTFSDIIAGYRDATEAKQKEIDRINELRAEYGSLVPSNVEDLATALDLIAPSVDAERRAKLAKVASDQAEDNDIESWAESFAKGEISIGNVPAKIRTAVKVAADKVKLRLASELDTELKSQIQLRVEKKLMDYEAVRSAIIGGGQIGSIVLSGLTAKEQRDYIDYVDGLEAQDKEIKKKGGKGLFNFFGANAPAPAPVGPVKPAAPYSPLFGPTTPGGQSPAGQLKPFDDAFVKPFRDLFNTPR